MFVVFVLMGLLGCSSGRTFVSRPPEKRKEKKMTLGVCNMEEFGGLESSEKTVAILGDKWWPQTAKHDDDRISKHFLCSMWKRRSERRNVGDVSIGSRNSALRLEGMRGQWSKDLRPATNE